MIKSSQVRRWNQKVHEKTRNQPQMTDFTELIRFYFAIISKGAVFVLLCVLYSVDSAHLLLLKFVLSV